MRAYSVPVALTIDSRYGHRRIRAALPRDAAGGLDPAAIVLDIHDEILLCLEALRLCTEAGPDVRPNVYGELELSVWPHWPTRLGRDLVAPTGAPLADQLAALRVRRPNRSHFRIALVGGFGGNLGDALLGATAWRAAMPVLATRLPSFSADVLLGPAAHPAVADLLSGEPGIGRVRFRPPTLEEFARYDAFFDFTDLIHLPHFHDGAAIDWILWWLGLDSQAVPHAAKRNRLCLTATAQAWAQSHLTARGPRVAFVWRASTPLRSMPDPRAAAFARDLLTAAPTITLVVDRPLALEHSRLLTIEANSAIELMALVTAVDGLVSVDTLAPHVADAADVPTVLILSSLPPARFPFYPNMAIVTPAGAEELPGWGITKVADEDWPAMSADYDRAWAGVSATACWDLLATRIASRPSPSERTAVGTTSLADEGSTADVAFPHDRSVPLDRWIAGEMTRYAAVVLAPGRTAILAGGDGTLALRLARMVSHEGALHVLEPRRLRAQALAAAVQADGLSVLHLHQSLAGRGAGHRRIADLDPASEADPGAWGNTLSMVEVAMTPLDDLRLPACDLIAIRPPQAWNEVLAGAEALLADTRPLLLAGPVIVEDHAALSQRLDALGYMGGLSAPMGSLVEDGALLLAVPAEAGARLEGFRPLGRFSSEASLALG